MCRTLLTCRQILVILVISSYMFQFILRTNISIAIVDMVGNNHSNATKVPRYDWNENQKNNILGCFYWGYALTSLIGGRLSELYGSKIMMGLGLLLASILTLLTPIFAHFHYYLLLGFRIGVGLALGLAWTSFLPLAIRWFGPTDRSKFLAHILASQLGGAVCLAFGGYLIDAMGWPSIFYITGGLCLVWCIFWFRLVYDTPRQHPRISQDERERIEREINFQNSTENGKVPWAKILTSIPVWTLFVTNFCLRLNANCTLNYVPTYMKQILDFDVKENGLLSGLPYVGTYITALVTCYLADKWRKEKRFSLLTIRRSFTTFTFLVPLLSLIVQSLFGYNRYVSVIVFVLWQSAIGSCIAGYTASVIDIAPTYSGSIYGISNALGAVTGYVSTSVFGLLVQEEGNFEQWRHVFWFMIVVNVFGLVVYFVFGSTKLQSWDPVCEDSAEKENLRHVNNL